MIKKPDCAWSLADLDLIQKNGIKVMSTFACGGGSSMGYKRAGCEVIAANDIDPEMASHYKLNINPKHYFLCPIRDLLTKELPIELHSLDILDGSPPCSSFSMAGNKEKDWGKDKHFREGQAKQVLDDLFFDYLDLVNHLRPKVSIAENVKGMTIGAAKGYLKLIMARYKEIGYTAQLFMLNSADCGVPQRRERVFFVAHRSDLGLQPLKLRPQHKWISCKDACADIQELTEEEKINTKPTGADNLWWDKTAQGESYSVAKKRNSGSRSLFSHVKLHGDRASPTLTATHSIFSHWGVKRKLTTREFYRLGSFPDDYKAKSYKIGKYMVGMSVPPKMTEQVARAVCEQWLGIKYNDKIRKA
jgi:DNA (cytosine-5)-methyltransferase 1